jgi:hypothetical protein
MLKASEQSAYLNGKPLIFKGFFDILDLVVSGCISWISAFFLLEIGPKQKNFHIVDSMLIV